MREGTVSQAVYERSVYRPLAGAGILPEENGFGTDAVSDRYGAVRSTAFGAADGFCMPAAEMILDEALNRLGPVCPGDELTVSVSVLIPPSMEEEDLRNLVRRLGEETETAEARMQHIACSVSAAVTAPAVTVSAGKYRSDLGGFGASPLCAGTRVSSGKRRFAGEDFPGGGDPGGSPDRTREGGRTDDCAEGFFPERSSQGVCECNLEPEGLDLLMLGSCGTAGTAVLGGSFREQLLTRLSPAFLCSVMETGTGLLTGRAAGAALSGNGFPVLYQAVGEGGVFAALWNMCERLHCGLEADLHRIPIRQETVEVCEILNRNPYRLYGTGALLIASGAGEAAAQRLREQGRDAEVIGHLTKGPGRYIRGRESTRCLEKPLADALLREG